MTPGAKSVFLSYASQDADAARRICDALRAADIEVWFDQSELRGGDAWDASIRGQIKACAIFVPIISRNTQAREEGYFRLEWKLAIDRSYLISAARAFLLPVVVDDSPQNDPGIPERFREVQWTRLASTDSLPAFAETVRRLLGDDALPLQENVGAPAPVAGSRILRTAPREGGPGIATAGRGVRSRMRVGLAITTVAALAAVFFLMRPTPPSSAPGPLAAPASFTPPPHSVAVLPFVNMSGDPKQDYFSDGLSEELLNSLVTVHDLQVAARTSSFSFKGKDTRLADIGRELNVGAVLEGSVRKDGSHVRITAQLVNAVTGFHLWSQTYDRDLRNVLALQTEIATAVTKALQATLLTNSAASTIELGGTQNMQAFDAFLRAERLTGRLDEKSVRESIDSYDQAIRFDPGFAKAYAGKARAMNEFAGYLASVSETAKYKSEARKNAARAIELAPELGRAHITLAFSLAYAHEFSAALAEIDRARALAPGDAFLLQESAELQGYLNRPAAAVVDAQRAAVLDPLNAVSYQRLGFARFVSREYRKAIDALDRAIALDPGISLVVFYRGLAYRALGDLDAAAMACSANSTDEFGKVCLAIVYHDQGRLAEAQQLLEELQRSDGDGLAYQYVQIYAQWGDIPHALQWLETAYRLGDGGLITEPTDILVDPLRREPRFREIERKLNFPW